MCSSSGMYVAFWRKVCSSLVSHPGSNPGILPNIVLYIKWKLRMESGPSLTLVALYKRVTQAKCSCCSLKKSDMSDSLFCSKKQAIRAWKKLYFSSCFFTIFHCFSLLCPRANRSYWSLLHCSFLKKRRERFALVTLYKRVTVSEALSSLFWIAISLFT